MISIEAEATVTSDGQMILAAPSNCPVGVHRVRYVLLDDGSVNTNTRALDPRFPKPKRYLLGRPVYDEDDLRGMESDLPPEDEWAREHGVL